MGSRTELRDALGLDDLPDDEFMHLLAEVGEEEVVSGVAPVDEEGWTPEMIRQALEE